MADVDVTSGATVFELVAAEDRRVRLHAERYRTLSRYRPEIDDLPNLVLEIERALVNRKEPDEVLLSPFEIYVGREMERRNDRAWIRVVVWPLDDGTGAVTAVVLMKVQDA